LVRQKKYKIIWIPSAELDLFEIIELVSSDNPSVAKKIFHSIQTKAKTLESFSTRGRIVPELRNLGVYVYHELIINPWRIIYKINQDKIYVMAVIDSRRDLQSVLLERLIR